jgi:hypothetical protein
VIITTVAGTATKVQTGEDMFLLQITGIMEGSIQLHPEVIADTVLRHVHIPHHHVHQVPDTLLLHVHPDPGPLPLHVREAIQAVAIQVAAAEAEDTDKR